MNTSLRIYIALVIVLALSAGLSVIYASPQLLPTEELPASKSILALVNVGVMIFIYGGLGLLGLKLSRKLKFTQIWGRNISNKQIRIAGRRRAAAGFEYLKARGNFSTIPFQPLRAS